MKLRGTFSLFNNLRIKGIFMLNYFAVFTKDLVKVCGFIKIKINSL